MGKITVYSFWSYDGTADKSKLSAFKRSAEEITRMGYKPDPATAEEIDTAELDLYGRYHPKSRA